MDKNVLRDKVYGGWFGKCLGGAVGMPHETPLVNSDMMQNRELIRRIHRGSAFSPQVRQRTLSIPSTAVPHDVGPIHRSSAADQDRG